MPHTPTRPTSSACLAAAAALTLTGLCAGDIIFVNAAQPLPAFSQTGASWAFAYKSLATALANAQPGDEVWVAKGTYQPTTTGSQTVSFTPPDGVRVLGGFNVGAASESERDPVANPTVLSGEIGAATVADNSQHVIRANGVSGTEFDGFLITGGNADGSSLDATGGAILVEGAAGSTDIVFRSCRIQNNHATAFGGAVSVRTDGAFFVDCLFLNNGASNGGAIDVQNGSVYAVNCRFLGNDANIAGAVNLASPNGSTFQNCLFSGNGATGAAGAINASSGAAIIETCTFAGNSAAISAGAMAFSSVVTIHLRNSIVWGNTANGLPNQFSGGGVNVQKSSCDIQGAASDAQHNFSSDPLFADPLGPDGVAGTEDDDLRLRIASPCVDRGDSGLLVDDLGDADGDGITAETLPIDLGGGARFRDDLVTDSGLGAPSDLDLGAYEFRRPGTTLCVDASAAPGGDGSTWAKAFTSLQSALSIVNTQTLEPPVRIWVANGTYKPTTTNDRTATFKISKDVGLYGGFGGGEPSLLDRFPQLNPTVLSGDIGVAGLTGDNSFHVVDVVVPSGGFPVIDGFFVSDGNASGGVVPIGGGGIRVTGGAGSLLLRGCRLVRNLGATGAGIMSAGATQVHVSNCYLAGNQCTGGGGGAAATSSQSTLRLTNCTLLGNTASVGGGASAQQGGTLVVLNSILYFNDANNGDGEAKQVTAVGVSSASASHSCIQCLGSSSSISPPLDCTGQNPAFIDAAGSDGVFGTSDDVVLLRSFSPCIDSGLDAATVGDIDDSDEDGDVAESTPFDLTLQGDRIVDDPAVRNGSASPIDMGAFERQSASFGLPPNPADLDGDGTVGPIDLALVLGAFGGDGPVGDVDADCSVDASDLALVLGAWTG